MKILAMTLCLLFASGCMLLPQPQVQASSRRLPPVISDLDNLEMLLLSEQQQTYENTRQLSGTENLHLGMKKNRVQLYLGRPNIVEVAGNPIYGNERWIYENQISTMDGYLKEKKVIYFEGGQVVGWESE